MLVIRLAPRQRIAPINSVFMFFHVGRVNSGANAVKADIISGVIASQVPVPYCFFEPQDTRFIGFGNSF
jgi:hypothetical protein